MYEYKTGSIGWGDRSVVEGDSYPGGQYGAEDNLQLKEGDMGLSWAVKKLGPKLKGGHMTFNMISGLYIPTWGPEWDDRESEYGYTKDDGTAHKRIAISWGREQQIGLTKGADDVQKDFMIQGINKMLDAGHEIGNHTVDHLETNSIWPRDLWPNGGDGFDANGNGDILGGDWNERSSGYSDSTASRGWMKYAGKKLQKDTWKDIITLGEQDGPKQGINTQLVGFRAPRLEINSNMFYALSEMGYTYDCGVEEGLELDVNGTNFLWPYTTDNGIPNFYTQMEHGAKLFVDSLPAGLWEIPVNLMVVPQNLRDSVWANHAVIAAAGGEELTTEDKDYWIQNSGKITGFDFNMFILWGMTKEQTVETMNHTLDLHRNNNRAPMQVGCHTDYFTPMYDFATLSNDDTYKHALTFNTWTDRKLAFEEFIDYAASKPEVQFVSGKELIEELRGIIADENVPAGVALAGETAWEFLEDDVSSVDVADATTFNGDSFNGKIKLNPSVADSSLWSYSSYMTGFDSENSELDGLSHISFNYNANVPLAVRIYVDGDMVTGADYQAGWEVVLNNKNNNVSSGPIPLSAFKYGKYSKGEAGSINTAKINSIEIAPLGADQECTFNISNIKLHGASNYTTPIVNNQAMLKSNLNVVGMTRNALNLNLGSAGAYTVKLFTANGRMVRSINAGELAAGKNSIDLGGVPAGLYMVEISSKTASVTTKAIAM